MGNAASLKPKKRLSQEMIDTGQRLGRIAHVLRTLKANVALEKSRDQTSSNTTATSQECGGRRDTSAWSKYFTRSDTNKELVDPEELKGAREQETKQMLMGESYFLETQAVIGYDVLIEEDLDQQQCGYCNIVNRDVVCGCRVCGLTFHRGCLVRRGIGQDTNSAQALNDSEKVGWSCPDCENLPKYLPVNEVSELMEKFDEYDRAGRLFMTLTDYVTVERVYQPKVSDIELRKQFLAYDHVGNGKVSWNDYSMTEAVTYLKKQTQNVLLMYLKPFEVDRLRRLYQQRDKENTGVLTVMESEKVYRDWLTDLDIPVADEFRKSMVRSSGLNSSNRLITWERFIRDNALSIITARPNTRTIRPYITSQKAE